MRHAYKPAVLGCIVQHCPMQEQGILPYVLWPLSRPVLHWHALKKFGDVTFLCSVVMHCRALQHIRITYKLR